MTLLHPAVLQLIHRLVQTATEHNKPVELCGEMASDPDGCVILVGLGIDTLSMNAPLIPVVKKRLSEISLSAAQISCPKSAECILSRRRYATLFVNVFQILIPK